MPHPSPGSIFSTGRLLLAVVSLFGLTSSLATASPSDSVSSAVPNAVSDPTPAPAGASEAAVREQVRALVRQAGQRMEQGDRANALAILEQARRLRPDPSIDYNLSIAYGELGKGPEAAQALERFLASADPSRVLPERLADAGKRLAEYEHTLSRLRARISLPPGCAAAALYIDQRPSALSLPEGRLIEPIWIAPGSHRLKVVAPGVRDYLVTIDLSAGELREVTGELYQDPTAATLLSAPPLHTGKEPQPLYKKWWFWTAIGAGAATAVALIAAGAAGAFNHIAPGTDLDPVELPH